MTTPITELILDTDPHRVGSMSTAELYEELGRGLSLVAENLLRAGQIWNELERRGEDLTSLRIGINVYLPLIGAGRMDARAVVRFAGNPNLLRALATLPIDEQIRLGKGETVPLVTEDRSIQVVDPRTLKATDVRQVFDVGRIRSTIEQTEILGRRLSRKIKRLSVRYERVQGGRFLIGLQVVLMSQVIAAMAMSEPGKKREKMVKVEAQLPDAIVNSLKLGAAESVKDFGTALLQAMRLAGMIT